MLNLILVLGSLALAQTPDADFLANSLAWQMDAERVDVTDLIYDEFKSQYLFPIKARLYSAWNGERPVRTPDFYELRFIARKNDHRFVFDCILRSYGRSYVGFGQIDTTPSYVILTDECRYRGTRKHASPEGAGLILARPFNRETVLFHANRSDESRH